MFVSVLVGFFHRSFQPHLDQMQHGSVHYPTGNRLKKLGMRNTIEVAAEICVNNFLMALSSSPTSSGAAHIWKRNRRTSPWRHPYVGRNCRIVYNEEHMEDPNLTIGPGSDVDSTRGSSPEQVRQPVDERL